MSAISTVNHLTAQTRTGLIEKTWQEKTFLFREDGFFNMTKGAKQFGKQLQNFWIAADTKPYMEELALSLNSNDKDLVRVKRGGGLIPEVGTWGHPKLAVFFARWLDARFAVHCDQMIDEILKGNVTLVKAEPTPASVVTPQPAPIEPEHSAMGRLMSAAVDVMRGLLAEQKQEIPR